jgi:hypothetical protein
MVDNPGAEERRREDIRRAVETARQQQLEDAVEEYLTTGHIEAPADERASTDQALRAEYEQALADQSPLIANPPPEGPLIEGAPPEGPLIDEGWTPSRAALAVGRVGLEAVETVLTIRTGVPNLVMALVNAVEAAIDTARVPGMKAKVATFTVDFATDTVTWLSTPPGTADIHQNALGDDLKETAHPPIEARWGEAREAPSDEDEGPVS